MFNLIFGELLDYLYGEIIAALTTFLTYMNGMGVQVVALPQRG